MKNAAALFHRLTAVEKIKFCLAKGDVVTALYHEYKHEINAKSEKEGVAVIEGTIALCEAAYA